MRPAIALLAGITVLAATAACSSAAPATALKISQPLPGQESLTYKLLDLQAALIGTATITIERQGDALALGQSYTDLSGHTDDGSVVIDASTMAPRSARRSLNTPSIQSLLTVTYAAGKVSTDVTGGGREQRHDAKVSTGAYDDLESFFLLRTLEFMPGYTVHFALVVSDAATGTISRAAASARVMGTSDIKVNGKSFKAWQVQLTGAGATNTAWFDSAPDRKLLRYVNSRETSIELANP